ncbi:MAG TPA: nitroreductase family deazaflavin-dependent oxidoreductase, partial [Solirubrobacteraceae bacterium]|nr:nitroreductase family deazaflavin-dependent oxidoreductase [Solirubrobacteraceae bacterium]
MGQVLKLHEALYKRSGGRVGHRMIGVPSLLLTTTGAKTGNLRTSALVYARDSADYLLVASNGGSDSSPAWLHNIRNRPEVEIQIGRRRMSGTARVIESADEEYDRLWWLVNENNHDR